MTTALDRVRAAYRRIAETDRPEVWITLRPQEEVEAEARSLDAARRRAASRSRGHPAGGEGQHRRGRPAHDRGLPVLRLPSSGGRARGGGAARGGRDRAGDDQHGPVRDRVWSAPGARTARCATRWTRSGSAAARAPARPSPWRWASWTSRWAPTRRARGGCRRRSTGSSGSSRPVAWCRPRVWSRRARVWTASPCSPARCHEARQALALLASPQAPARRPGPWRVAVAATAQLGELDAGWAEAYEAAADRLAAAGAELRTIDLTPFTEAAELLYEGAFVAERYTAVGAFVDKGPLDLDPTVARIITAARDLPAHRLFADQERLAALRLRAAAELGGRRRAAAADDARPPHPRRGRRRPPGRQHPARPVHQLHQPAGHVRRWRSPQARWTACRSA